MTLTSKQANNIIETYKTLQATQLVPQALGCEDQQDQDCTSLSRGFSLQYATTLTMLEGDKKDRGSSGTERLHAAADEACTVLANPALNLSSAHYCAKQDDAVMQLPVGNQLPLASVPLKATPAFYSDTEKLTQTLLRCASATTPAACAAVGIGCRWSEKCDICENPLAKKDADCPKRTRRPRYQYEPQDDYANQDDYGTRGHQDDGWGGFYH